MTLSSGIYLYTKEADVDVLLVLMIDDAVSIVARYKYQYNLCAAPLGVDRDIL